MRVISGFLKGRNILGYTLDGTRPTMDRVKESLFGIIQSYVNDSICLDLFAGSGSLGIEAISNGAKKCYFVDKSNNAIKVLNKNLNNFNIENKTKIIKSDYTNALDNFKNNKIKFDIIFLDPPYKMHILNDIINKIIEKNLINNGGIIICEVDFEYLDKSIKNLELIKQKKYGSTYLYIYKNCCKI